VSKLTRREVIGLIAAAMPASLFGCQKPHGLSCTDTSGLTPREVHWRKGKGYVEPTPEPGKVCAQCAFFEPPRSTGFCGACKVFKGPVHPQGYCFDFVPAKA
jgi:hypothetical protein